MGYPIELACIIDDDGMYVNLITRIIDAKKLSKNLLLFSNGKEALDYFVAALNNIKNQGIPKVILLDLNMPVMDGWQFLTELGKHRFDNLNNTTIYIVSSSIDPSDLERSKAIEMVADFLIKPVNFDQLERVFLQEGSASA
jgi:CheY-like chemotaxis protein